MALHGASISNRLASHCRRFADVTWNATLNFDYCRFPTEYLKYQSYFFQGLNSLECVKVAMKPRLCSLLAKLFRLRVRGVNRLWAKLQEYEHPENRIESNHVGRYYLSKVGQSPIKIAIDVSDGRDVRDSNTLEWCDVYFKTNRWPSLNYPHKVRPLMNANGLLTQSNIDQLIKLRASPKSIDLVYWAKIWEPTCNGGHYSSQDCSNIVEHQIRLFEALSKSACSKDLLAILPENLKGTSTDSCIKRLEACGVKWQYSWGEIRTRDFWQRLATAKIVFIRSGNHLCISWRMTDLLAMGACIMCDGSPYPNWQVPLESDVQFIDGQCNFKPDFSLPPGSCYERLPVIIERLLSDEKRMRSLRKQAAMYFDSYGKPEALASYILDTVNGR